MQHTADADEHLIQMPSLPGSGRRRAKSAPNFRHQCRTLSCETHDTALSQDQLDVAQTEAEDVIQPYGVARAFPG